MANMDHVQIVKQGRDAVARWREEHPGETLDLNAAYMSHTRIPQVDLSGSDLRHSDLMGTMLRRANLSGSYLNPSHLYRADLREADLTRCLFNGANLRGADLRRADLSGADLDRATLSDANLSGANLSGANLSRTNLTGANLSEANLSGANFNGASLSRVNLSGANLEGSDFYEATFNAPELAGASFSGAIMGYTVFQNCDFGEAQGMDQVRHDAPSTLGVDSLFRSAGRIPGSFLTDIGSPDSLLAFQKSIVDAPLPSGDCFISCAGADVDFARQLQSHLRGQGVRCWLFPDNARGSALVDRRSTSEEEEVERWVRHYDRLIVVCSVAALESETVRNDIIQAQERQQSRDEWMLYLVSPDGTMVQPRHRLARNLSYEHNIFDLSGQSDNSAGYQEELARLADNLKKTQPASADRPPVTDQL